MMRQISNETREEVKSLIKKLNHRAKIIESCRGKVSVAEIINTGLFKLDVAQSGYGWLQDLHAMTVREVRILVVVYRHGLGLLCQLQ